MNKKFIYLFIALALPGLIFVFLKRFGKNEFTVPIYYENGLPKDSICVHSASGIYHVSDTTLEKIFGGKNKSAKVVVVYPFVMENLSEITRISNHHVDDSVKFKVISGVPNSPKTSISVQFFDYGDFGNIVTCELRVREPWSVVLLDDQNRIRGYYDGSRRDEMDRLDLELSILLKKY